MDNIFMLTLSRGQIKTPLENLKISYKVMKARSSGRAVQGAKILRKVKVKFYVDNILMQNQFKG